MIWWWRLFCFTLSAVYMKNSIDSTFTIWTQRIQLHNPYIIYPCKRFFFWIKLEIELHTIRALWIEHFKGIFKKRRRSIIFEISCSLKLRENTSLPRARNGHQLERISGARARAVRRDGWRGVVISVSPSSPHLYKVQRKWRSSCFTCRIVEGLVICKSENGRWF